jgi:hypothetical protein
VDVLRSGRAKTEAGSVWVDFTGLRRRRAMVWSGRGGIVDGKNCCIIEIVFFYKGEMIRISTLRECTKSDI